MKIMYIAAKKTAQSQPKADTQIELLVEKAICGDADALSNLCEKIEKNILSQVAITLGCSLEDAEDFSQNVLICVCRHIHRLQSPKAFKTWLARVMINKKNDYLREKMRRGTLLNIDNYSESVPEKNPRYLPQGYDQVDELRSALKGMIFQLPTRQRQATTLYYYHDMRVTDIARVLGVRTQSVSKHLALVRYKLKHKLHDLM